MQKLKKAQRDLTNRYQKKKKKKKKTIKQNKTIRTHSK